MDLGARTGHPTIRVSAAVRILTSDFEYSNSRGQQCRCPHVEIAGANFGSKAKEIRTRESCDRSGNAGTRGRRGLQGPNKIKDQIVGMPWHDGCVPDMEPGAD